MATEKALWFRGGPPPELTGHSPLMDQLRTLIRKVARTNATVLIQGEPGAGKERVARALVEQSPRAGAAVLTLDCAGLPESALDLRLFGAHPASASASAAAESAGAFELAQGGTIILKEPALIPLPLQARLLRVLQKQEIERPGLAAFPIDVRLLALTNRRLDELVKRNEFREDLYLALSIVPIILPPLRDRFEDIPELAEYFRQTAGRRCGRETLPITPALAHALQNYSWPGNVRELENAIARAVLLAPPGGALQAEHLGLGSAGPACESSAGQPPDGQDDSLAAMEKKHIFAILEKCGGNRTHAAGRLGISIRTLRNKLREYKTDDASGDSPAPDCPEEADS